MLVKVLYKDIHISMTWIWQRYDHDLLDDSGDEDDKDVDGNSMIWGCIYIVYLWQENWFLTSRAWSENMPLPV